jgi:hypothetical protein
MGDSSLDVGSVLLHSLNSSRLDHPLTDSGLQPRRGERFLRLEGTRALRERAESGGGCNAVLGSPP